MQVLEHEHQSALGGGVEHLPDDGLPGPEVGRTVGGAGSRGQLGAERCQDLDPRPQRGGAAVLRAPPDHGRDPPRGRPCAQLGDQPGLADAGLARERGQPRPGAAVSDAVEEPVQRGGLGVAPHQRPRWAPGGPAAGGPGLCGDQHRQLDLAQHGRLDGAELVAGLQAQLGVEQVAHLGQHRRRLALAARAGEGQDVQRPQPLPQRVPAGERLDLGGHRGVPTQEQPQHRAVLLSEQAQLLEPTALPGHLRVVAQVGVRRRPPPFLGGPQPPQQLHRRRDRDRRARSAATAAGPRPTGRPRRGRRRRCAPGRLHRRRRRAPGAARSRGARSPAACPRRATTGSAPGRGAGPPRRSGEWRDREVGASRPRPGRPAGPPRPPRPTAG